MLSKTKRPYDPEAHEPRTRLRKNLTDLAANNALSATRLVEISQDVNRVDRGSCSDYARIPIKSKSGKGNAKRNLMGKALKGSKWFPAYWKQVRVKNLQTGAIEWEWLAIQLIHETVHTLAAWHLRKAPGNH